MASLSRNKVELRLNGLQGAYQISEFKATIKKVDNRNPLTCSQMFQANHHANSHLRYLQIQMRLAPPNPIYIYTRHHLNAALYANLGSKHCEDYTIACPCEQTESE